MNSQLKNCVNPDQLAELYMSVVKFIVYYLIFGTSKTFSGQVPHGNLLVYGQVSSFAISTPLGCVQINPYPAQPGFILF